MTRLRFVARLNPSKTEAGELASYGNVTFAPMDAIADGLGGLDTSLERPADELADGNYNYFAEGDLLLAKVTPCFENGKKALVTSLPNSIGFATSEVHVVRLDRRKVDPSYLRYLFSSETFRAAGIASMTGAGGLRRISDNAIKDFHLPIADLNTQRAIAAFLDRETTRIGQLIAKNERIADLVSAKWEALIHDERQAKDAKWVRLNTAVRRVQRPIGMTDDKSFVPLGLYNRGRGFFKKVETDEKDLGDSDFFWVREGDIVFSGQFAWEGAIGYVNGDEDGCVVSHRYPVYRAREGIDGAYLYAFFRTAHGAFLMDNCSRGAAGRNRPLNTWSLERELVLIPSEATQEKIARLVTLEQKARRFVTEYVRKASELRSALITAAVTDQIDVRENVAIVTAKPDRSKFRLLVGSEIIHRHQNTKRFGRIKNQKLLYLAEAHAGIRELQGNYLRWAAGPYDAALTDEVDRSIETASYFRAQTAGGDGHGVTYVPLSKAGQHSSDLKGLLGDRLDALRKIVDLLHDFETESVEAIATLYAVWNDALIDGETPDDDRIIRGVLSEWHEKKADKFKRSDLEHWLDWMRRNDFVPHGQGPRTIPTITGDLFR